ncbi:uncharacterized protein [Physcomitrium patens]|uniref:Uncharacterized protein n=1 Tax=Physcomitrium patens TaxID=3218 RepID=A0A2K1K333_PHYPA|nr:uncharacterized protein LOC112286909 [Physcomitrium patens]PNR48187.1 hypothetical protein PHYPA_012662 [Physcomitrium patens]|eukprot:XP_024385066.1 uncharacterized protein LOC112286909 [Physcomitrella patens]
MGKCKHHPQSVIPGDGICPSCLQKKLNSVWRGESYSDVSAKDTVSYMAPHRLSTGEPIHPQEAISVIGSIASITKRSHLKQFGRNTAGLNIDSRRADDVHTLRKAPHPSFDRGDAGVKAEAVGVSMSGLRTEPRKLFQDRAGFTQDWTELYTKRRSDVSPSAGSRLVSNTVSGGLSVGSRSKPLVDRIAKETAMRVIREVGDRPVEEAEGISPANRYRERSNLADSDSSRMPHEKAGSVSPLPWHSKIRSKWVKGLGSPMNSSNKIFPSKSVETVQKSQVHSSSPAREHSRPKPARGDKKASNRVNLQIYNVEHDSDISSLRAKASKASETVIEGMPDQILRPEDMKQRLRTSHNTVLLWLQDLPCPQSSPYHTSDGWEDPCSSSSDCAMETRNNDLYHEDLTLVGHLHEIAEEHEYFEECSEEQELRTSTTNHLSDVSSFGKFLIRAAQRQPKEGLSRVALATPAR